MDYVKEYNRITGRECFYNIMPIANLSSVFKHGILSKNKMKSLGISAASVADADVQERRDKVVVPNGLPLHSYANLYFDFWNPMLSRIRAHNREICILQISLDVINCKDIVFSDMNASRSLVGFWGLKDFLKELDFDTIFMNNWKDSDYDTEYLNKGRKCAEILIPHCIPTKFISEITVCSYSVKNEIESIIPQGINVAVRPYCFF